MNIAKSLSNTVVLCCWSDDEFAADKDDRKSVSGGVVTVDGAVVQWVCKKQTGVSLSMMEAEFTSASHIGREMLGLRELVNEVGFLVAEPICMMMDNQAAIQQLKFEDSMASAKHVDIRLKFIRDYAMRGIVRPEYPESRLMKADLLTKVLPLPRTTEL